MGCEEQGKRLRRNQQKFHSICSKGLRKGGPEKENPVRQSKEEW
jgi:hypothetical protein